MVWDKLFTTPVARQNPAGALVFDVADLVKDAYVMPVAFLYGAEKAKQQEYRGALIEICQKEEILDRLFTFVSELAVKQEDKQ